MAIVCALSIFCHLYILYFHACTKFFRVYVLAVYIFFLICQSSSVNFCFSESAHVFDIGNTCNNSSNNSRLTVDWSSTDVTTGIIDIFFFFLFLEKPIQLFLLRSLFLHHQHLMMMMIVTTSYFCLNKCANSMARWNHCINKLLFLFLFVR